MSDIRAAIIIHAHSWLETPYHHQARIKNVGVDCAQLVAGIAEDVGLIDVGTPVPFNYSPEWHLHNREEVLIKSLEFFGCKPILHAEPGDILCFKYGRAIGHLGIMVSETEMIHAAIQAGKVVLNSLTPELLKRHCLTYSFPYPRGTS
jgi:NlpC/P60 family putative phage cell wall peptidase